MAVDRYAAEDRSPLDPGTSAHMMPACTVPAAGVQLIGFHCLVCGYVLHAENRHPSPAPMCAGSKARTGKQHESTLMQPLFLH
jgi:hypothetical protein